MPILLEAKNLNRKRKAGGFASYGTYEKPKDTKSTFYEYGRPKTIDFANVVPVDK